jgi:hypothetical protein
MSYATTKPAWLEYTSFGATPPAGFDASNPLNWCGSCAAVQEMLADLGFYMGEFDGNVTGPVRESLESFAQSKGMSTTGGITAQLCAVLKDTWLKQQGGGGLVTTERKALAKTISIVKPKLKFVSRVAPSGEPGGSVIGIRLQLLRAPRSYRDGILRPRPVPDALSPAHRVEFLLPPATLRVRSISLTLLLDRVTVAAESAWTR